jgi:crossover junction endodeoxyribonuclease RusA
MANNSVSRGRSPRSYTVRMPVLPWDFVVIGTPLSAQASGTSKARWKTIVAAAAQAAWPAGEPPLVDKLQIQITCFHNSAPPLDADNMLKPIQDALIGIVYADDRQLTDTHGALRDINDRYLIKGVTPALASGFVAGVAFVHIRVAEPPDLGRLA